MLIKVKLAPQEDNKTDFSSFSPFQIERIMHGREEIRNFSSIVQLDILGVNAACLLYK